MQNALIQIGANSKISQPNKKLVVNTLKLNLPPGYCTRVHVQEIRMALFSHGASRRKEEKLRGVLR